MSWLYSEKAQLWQRRTHHPNNLATQRTGYLCSPMQVSWHVARGKRRTEAAHRHRHRFGCQELDLFSYKVTTRVPLYMSKIRVFLCLALWLAAMDAVMAQERYQVGVCDWMVLKRQKLGAFELAKQLGCDGIELDMGSLGQRDTFENKLRIPKEAALFKKTADSLGIQVGAVAMSGFYAQDLSKKDTYLSLAEDCFDTMDKMGGVTVAFLPLGGCGNDWTTNKAKRAIIVKRLHEIGEAAKSRGKRVGIDTPLDAKGNLRLLKEIHSDGIGIFYKFQTIIENGWDLCKDMARLGSKNICAIHASNTDKVWLREDSCVNLPAIKQTLDQMGWSGWLFVERSRSTKMVRNVKMNYGNQRGHPEGSCSTATLLLLSTSQRGP